MEPLRRVGWGTERGNEGFLQFAVPILAPTAQLCPACPRTPLVAQWE